jgi:hypothetical protein
MFEVREHSNRPVVRGLAVNTGVYEGPAALVADVTDFARVRVATSS